MRQLHKILEALSDEGTFALTTWLTAVIKALPTPANDDAEAPVMGRPRKHNKGLPTRVVLRHGAYHYITPTGQWKRLAKAGDLVNMHRALADAMLADENRMSLVFDLYARRILPGKAPKTRETQEPQLEKLRTKFGARDPNTIESHEIAEYLDDAPHKTAANREIALLSSVFTNAVRWGKARRNPCLGVERHVESPRRVYVSSPTFWAAWTDAPLHIGLVMELSLTTGQRLGDVLALKWTAVHEDGIHFLQRKTGVAIVIGWTEWLQDLIARCRTLSGASTHVLVTARGKRWTTDGFKTVWQRFMRDRSDRFQFRDIRKKSGNDGATGAHLGNDPKTFAKWYQLKPKRASALSGREILDSVLDTGE